MCPIIIIKIGVCENLDLSQTSISDERIYNSLNVGAYKKLKFMFSEKASKI